MDEPSLDRVKQVFEQWSLYDLIIQHNYMRHSELISYLNEFIKQSELTRTVIDLGCGDAWLAKHVFQGVVVGEYCGVDLSDTALHEAAEQLSRWSTEKQFHQGDIAEFLTATAANSFNTALVSYSLHHFKDDKKAVLLAQIQRILVAGGQLLWIDLARTEAQTRDQYVELMANHIRDQWRELSESQTEQAFQHVLESDFPATEGWMLEQATAAGLNLERRLFRDEFFGAWVFTKPGD